MSSPVLFEASDFAAPESPTAPTVLAGVLSHATGTAPTLAAGLPLPPPRFAVGTDLRDHDLARMAQVEGHADFARMNRLGLYTPPNSAYDLAAVMTCAGMIAAAGALGVLGAGVVGVVAALVGLGWAIGGISLARQTHRGRGQARRMVAMVDGRIDAVPGRTDEVRVRLRVATGTEYSVATTAGLAQALLAGDVGLAYLRGDRMLAFWRVNASCQPRHRQVR